MAAGSGGLASGEEAFRCGLKDPGGLSPSDADTAARLICEQLRRASGARGSFGITLATLGKVVVVTAAREGTADAVTVQLDTIEEVPVAAVRIAEALVHGQAFATTQRVDNLLEGETRPALAKKGAIKFALGVADLESPGHGARGAAFSLGIIYAAPRFALPAEIRFGWDASGDEEAGLSLFSMSIGGRWYPSKRDVSPLFGGGLGILRLYAREGAFPYPGGPSSGYFEAERFSVAPYVEVGLEVLRLHRGRIGFLIRADVPIGSLRSDPIPVFLPWDGRAPGPRIDHVLPAQSRYVVPVTIGVNVAF